MCPGNIEISCISGGEIVPGNMIIEGKTPNDKFPQIRLDYQKNWGLGVIRKNFINDQLSQKWRLVQVILNLEKCSQFKTFSQYQS